MVSILPFCILHSCIYGFCVRWSRTLLWFVVSDMVWHQLPTPSFISQRIAYIVHLVFIRPNSPIEHSTNKATYNVINQVDCHTVLVLYMYARLRAWPQKCSQYASSACDTVVFAKTELRQLSKHPHIIINNSNKTSITFQNTILANYCTNIPHFMF